MTSFGERTSGDFRRFALTRTPVLGPELDLFFLGQRTHVSNYGCFFLHDGINLADELNDPRSVAAYIGVVPEMQGLDVDQQPSLIS
jgi:hypothetical protein